MQNYLILWQGLQTRKQALKLLKDIYKDVEEIQQIEVDFSPIVKATINNYMMGDNNNVDVKPLDEEKEDD